MRGSSKPPVRRSRDRAKKTRSNQMLEQRQHFFSMILRPRSVDPAGHQIRTYRTVDWCINFTNLAKNSRHFVYNENQIRFNLRFYSLIGRQRLMLCKPAGRQPEDGQKPLLSVSISLLLNTDLGTVKRYNFTPCTSTLVL